MPSEQADSVQECPFLRLDPVIVPHEHGVEIDRIEGEEGDGVDVPYQRDRLVQTDGRNVRRLNSDARPEAEREESVSKPVLSVRLKVTHMMAKLLLQTSCETR